jgi:hypothetical protein
MSASPSKSQIPVIPFIRPYSGKGRTTKSLPLRITQSRADVVMHGRWLLSPVRSSAFQRGVIPTAA